MSRRFCYLLLSLLIISCEDFQDDPIRIPASNYKLFTLLSPDSTGIQFSNDLPDNEYVNILTYEYFYNGGGVAIADINNDDLPDIYMTANMGSNKLYLNKGDFMFEDITELSGVGGSGGWCTGVTMVDINADGNMDIYVSRSGKFKPEKRANELFINNGDLTFTESSKDFGLADQGYSTQALFFDFDRDNDLDMFLLNHSVQLFPGEDAMKLVSSHDPYAGDKLFRNDKGKFTDISKSSGIHTNPLGYGLGVTAGDLNNDGWTDLYITNDYLEPDYLYINNGDGTFTNKIKEATKHISNFGMGVDIADINNDGYQDIFVTDMVAEDNYRQKTNMRTMSPEQFYQAVDFGFHYQYMFNTLQLNRGNGHFSEIGQLAGVSSTDWSWATLLTDLDNDQYKDLIVTNGFRKEYSNKDYMKFRDEVTSAASSQDQTTRIQAMRTLLDNLPVNKIANYVFHNNGDLTFSNFSESWNFNQPSHSNGASYADLDMDGDMDIVINNVDSKAFVYKNHTVEKGGGNYLKVKLRGPGLNIDGIGAKVTIHVNNNSQNHEQYLTRGYQSSVEPLIHFGLGGYPRVDSVVTTWPDGSRSVEKRVKANKVIEIKYKNEGSPLIQKETSLPIFLDLTRKVPIDYVHVENDFYDFEREILLPHKMSNFGPALAVGDLNNDGLEDLIVGGAKGYTAEIYLQLKGSNFQKHVPKAFENDKGSEDIDAELFDANNDGFLDIYLVSGGNDFNPKSPELQDRLYINNKDGSFDKSAQLPEMLSSGSVIRPYDFDNDGDLDLFIGGRVIPGRYPQAPQSFLLMNEQGNFKDVTTDFAPELKNPGMVTDAIWTDFNSDGQPDLIVVGEWMSIMMMENKEGLFENVSRQYGLDQETGWWFSINQGDFNNDGLMDYIVGNLGLNYKYKASHAEPFQVYCDDFDQSGTLDIVLGYFNKGELFPLRGRQCSSEQMPFIKEKFETYHEFGSASLEDIYGEQALSSALHYNARNFSSIVLINQNNVNFSLNPLPNICQISSINSSIVEDFDKDGNQDILLAGNLHPVETETIRNDASVGMLLLGRGNGNFDPVSPKVSGVLLNKDSRKMLPIRLNNEYGVLVANNQDILQLLILNSSYEFKDQILRSPINPD